MVIEGSVASGGEMEWMGGGVVGATGGMDGWLLVGGGRRGVAMP